MNINNNNANKVIEFFSVGKGSLKTISTKLLPPFFRCSDYHYGTANRLCRKTLASDFLVI